MTFTEDLAAMMLDFGSTATLDGVTVRGIFDADYQLLDAGGSLAGSAPVFLLPTSDVPSPVAGLLLVHNTVTYKVVEPMPDGTGVTALRLRV